jgi:hypothetical protein
MDLHEYLKDVVPKPPLSESDFIRVYEPEFGYSYENYLTKFSEHDALHYLYEELFSSENELKIAKLETIYNVGFVGRNYFFYCIPPVMENLIEKELDDTITVELIKSIAKQLRELY